MGNLFSTDFLVFMGRKRADLFCTGSLVLAKNGYSNKVTAKCFDFLPSMCSRLNTFD